ncbi:MAG: hypothetical protein AAFX92_18520 [Pseudomonadota bacterium]
MTRHIKIASIGAGLLLLSTFGSAAAQDTPEEVAAACLANSNMPEDLCDCVGASSLDLTSDQRAFYIAALNGNDAETARLRGVMSFDEITGIATFMRDAPADCAG